MISKELILEIELDLAELFKNTKKIDRETYKHPGDTTGKSTIKEILYDFKSGDAITLACYDWSKETEKISEKIKQVIDLEYCFIDYNNQLS